MSLSFTRRKEFKKLKALQDTTLEKIQTQLADVKETGDIGEQLLKLDTLQREIYNLTRTLKGERETVQESHTGSKAGFTVWLGGTAAAAAIAGGLVLTGGSGMLLLIPAGYFIPSMIGAVGIEEWINSKDKVLTAQLQDFIRTLERNHSRISTMITDLVNNSDLEKFSQSSRYAETCAAYPAISTRFSTDTESKKTIEKIREALSGIDNTADVSEKILKLEKLKTDIETAERDAQNWKSSLDAKNLADKLDPFHDKASEMIDTLLNKSSLQELAESVRFGKIYEDYSDIRARFAAAAAAKMALGDDAPMVRIEKPSRKDMTPQS